MSEFQETIEPIDFFKDNANSNRIKAENNFNFTTNKNNFFVINFKNCSNYIEINSNPNNNKLYSSFENKYYLKDLRDNKYLSILDSIDDIYEQLLIELRKKNQKIVIEDNDIITVIIPVEHIGVKEIKFILKGKRKNEKEQIKDLYEELNNLKENMREEINKIKNDLNSIKEENQKLKEKNLYFEDN